MLFGNLKIINISYFVYSQVLKSARPASEQVPFKPVVLTFFMQRPNLQPNVT